MRAVWIAIVALIVACGGADVPPASTSSPPVEGGGGVDATGGGGSAPTLGEDPFEPAPPSPPLPAEAVAALATSIDTLLDALPDATHGVHIVGADTGQIIYERNPDSPLKPASNTKLFSSAAALAALGEQARRETRVVTTATVSNGVVQGNLVLLGRHDHTWSTWFYETEAVPLDDLAAQLAAAGITSVTGNVEARGELLLEGYNFGTYAPATTRATAAARFVAALEDAGITTGTATTSPDFSAPEGATELARWRSLPLDAGCSPINRSSHNEFADILMRHVGWAMSGTSSYGEGAAEVVRLLQTGGVVADGLQLFDGSGLSHDNRATPRQITGLLGLMYARSEGQAWRRTFAVAGVQGTIGSRMEGADTAGRFWAKTGTLSDTVALSGVLHHRYDGQRYFVAALMNDVTDKAAARTTHDAIVTALAADLRQLGERPAAPLLQTVRGVEGRIRVRWTPVSSATGYLVWRSRDGKRWSRDDARLVTESTHHTVPFDDSPRLFVRVSALGPAGESDPSDVYGARLGDAPVIVIDGNDRWQAQPVPENHLGAGHDFVVRYGEALPGGFDSCANEAVTAGECPLADHPVVLWSLGEESVDQEALSSSEMQALEDYVDGGGKLIISGAELAYHLGSEATDEAATFLEDVLGVTFAGDDADTYLLEPTGDGLPRVMGFFTPDRMVVRYPDQLTPAPGSTVWLRYRGGAGGVAGVRTAHGFTFGVPLESIDGADDRAQLLAALLAE